MKKRMGIIKRKTRETDIGVKLNIDGSGCAKIETGIGFVDHMLELFTFHGFFDLELKARGDLNVDLHHTNEDVGIALGEAFRLTLGKKKGIRRFGLSAVPMDEALVLVVADISGRPSLVITRAPAAGDEPRRWRERQSAREKKTPKYTLNDTKQFLKAFVNTLGLTLHIQIMCGEDTHHILEAIFKGLGRALDEATQIEARKRGIPSTKGKI